MNTSNEIFLSQGEGESYWVLGDLYVFKATGKQTNGAYTVIDQVIQPQNGPPPHIHHREDEAFYILNGTFSFMSGGKENIHETGSFVYIPRGTLHTFRNVGPGQGRLLVLITPAGLEEFFYSIGTPAAGSASPPPFDPGVIDKLMTLANKFELEILLPESK